ncbi:MAG: hypothetical protein ACFE8V_16285 [Promethearchaeota archaeon]
MKKNNVPWSKRIWYAEILYLHFIKLPYNNGAIMELSVTQL